MYTNRDVGIGMDAIRRVAGLGSGLGVGFGPTATDPLVGDYVRSALFGGHLEYSDTLHIASVPVRGRARTPPCPSPR